MKKLFIAFIIVCLLFGLCGCEKSEVKDNNKKIIAVSIVPQATFVEAVCGENFEIITLIPTGASPETYELTTNEMKKLSKSDIYFSIGVPVEESSILPVINEKTKVIALHETVAQSYPDLTEDGGRDPHIWLSPKRVKIMINKIAEELCTIDSQNESLYMENAEKYIDNIDDADRHIKALLDGKEGCSFITFHPSFGYFADEYQLTQYALEEHGKEATAKRLIEMADLARQKGIKVIFYQAEASSRQAKAFAEEIGGKAISLEPLSADYIGNLNRMAKALSDAVK